MELRSISNRMLTLLRKLNRKKYREREGLFLVEGDRAVEQVLEHGKIDLKTLFFDEAQAYWEREVWQKWAKQIEAFRIGDEAFREISDTDNPQGVLALCQIPGEVALSSIGKKKGIIIATDRIRDPGNLGTILRTASWFGACGILCGKGTVDLFHPKVVRSTAGATGSVSHRKSILEEDLRSLEKLGWQVFLLSGDADSLPLKSIDPPAKSVLVTGNEAGGIAGSLFSDERVKVKVPSGAPQEGAESLNAAIATAIALYAFTG